MLVPLHHCDFFFIKSMGYVCDCDIWDGSKIFISKKNNKKIGSYYYSS